MVTESIETSASTCRVCEHTACCTHLPVHSFTVTTRDDWARVLVLADAPGFLVGLRGSGDWIVFWNARCRFLDRNRRCSLHGDPRRPDICRAYNEYHCWYRRAFSDAGSDAFIRFPVEALFRVGERLSFDSAGALEDTPSWEEMLRLAGDGWYRDAPADGYNAGRLAADTPVVLTPPGRPTRFAHLDLVRFRLGFPGVRLVASDSGWAYAFAPEPATEWRRRAVLDPFGTGADLHGARLTGYDGIETLRPELTE